MHSRRSLWLVAAVLLLALAAYLASGDAPAPKPERHVAFPERQTRAEYDRAERRRTLLPVLAAAVRPDAGRAKRLRPTDPVLAALPPKGPRATAMVFEANAIRNSPVGQLLLDCLRARAHGGPDPIDALRQKTGIDVTQDLDRLAVTDEGFTASGNFAGANWDAVFSGAESHVAYGDQGIIYSYPPPAPGQGPPGQEPLALARWGNGMLIFAQNTDQAKATIDRLEGRAPDAAPLLDESDAYGEVYGTLDPADLAGLMPDDAANVAAQLRSAAQQVKLHVDATSDVAIVADISGPDAQQVSDLGKALGGAIALGRLKATDSQLLDDLLDQAKVTQGDGSFRTELALPLSVLQKRLGWCREALDGGAPPTPPSPAAPALPSP